MTQVMKTRKGTLSLGTAWGRQAMAALVLGVALTVGGHAAGLPKGTLQVQDIQADPKGYTGRILVRGVVALISPTDPQNIRLIDSREARVCQDLHCASFYLPVKAKAGNFKPWEEVDIHGTLMQDSKTKTFYLAADSVDNLGAIRK